MNAKNEQARAWQRMLSGRRLDLLDPSPLDIEIKDIIHGLYVPKILLYSLILFCCVSILFNNNSISTIQSTNKFNSHAIRRMVGGIGICRKSNKFI